ncbi:MAG TPA: tRNA pseudouridine(38-40) synthase TruA [Bacteroidales bacterium]|nr:tRNA pseudouridine(38-40) synthase TruA [Bacteroidales bacterium]HPT20749.1 tRNA pseudouridine(38-40) synthase TruA [Bacteroidales bacterium]
MGRYKLTIEYDGTRYSGWQMQKGGKTIQGEILDACREVFKGAEIDLFGAGRTDGGVHALGQIAHLGVETDIAPLRIKYGINDNLPPDICILNVEEANPKFHARHDANARSYIYQISRRRTAFGKKYVWWIKDQLDVELMNEAAKYFSGLKDYRYFTDEAQEQSSTKVEILHARVNDFGDMLVFHVVGSHFLWKQVRRMTGVLAEVGRGKLKPADVASFFKIKTDIPAKLTAPPSGLFLEKVYYRDEEISYQTNPVIRI